MIVEQLAVGTELLLGQIANTNAAVIAERLAAAGMDHYLQAVVGDNQGRIAAAVRAGLERSEAIIITGGLGPTPDDLTREAIAEATGLELVFEEGWAEELRRRADELGRDLPESNLRQAWHPEGATLIRNPKGSAPGLDLEVDGRRIFALPGVPEEMVWMLDHHVVPELVRMAGDRGVVVSRLLRSWGLPEAEVAERLDDLFQGSKNPTLAFLASAGEIKVRLTAKAADQEEAERLLAPLEEEVRRRLGEAVTASDGETVEETLVGALLERGWRVVTAESATAGAVAARLGSVPGVSRVFLGGVVAYHPDLKRSLLEVPQELVESEGLVSEATALAMAEGAARMLGAEVGVGVTGSAGPEELEQPAGTMVVAVRTPEDARARTLRFPGDRERVRAYTTTAALHLALRAVTGTWWSR